MDLPPSLPSLPDLPSIRRGRRKPKTLLGKLIRAWPWIRLGLRIGRFALRLRRAVTFAVAGIVFTAVVRLVRLVLLPMLLPGFDRRTGTR